jgi:hypothetical protein
MTRNRDRKASLLVRGRKPKFWLVQWPEGDKRPSHKLGWCDEMTVSQKEQNYPKAGPNDWVLSGKNGRPIDMNRVIPHHVRRVAQTLGICNLLKTQRGPVAQKDRATVS